MNELITIKGVRGYIDENGTAQLNLEDISRGLGFTQKAASGNVVVRRERVKKYLLELNSIPTSGDGFSQLLEKDIFPEYIPENIFYRLAMKAKNDTAEKFQMIVANEILPSIRKHGAYMTPKKIEEVLLNPDTIINLATQLKREREERLKLESKVELDKPKVIFADAVSVSKSAVLVGDLAKILKQNGIEIGAKRFFEWLRENGYLIKRKGTDYNMPTQKSMELGLFEIKESVITHSDGHTTISKTPKVTGKGQIYFINKFKSELEAR